MRSVFNVLMSGAVSAIVALAVTSLGRSTDSKAKPKPVEGDAVETISEVARAPERRSIVYEPVQMPSAAIHVATKSAERQAPSMPEDDPEGLPTQEDVRAYMDYSLEREPADPAWSRATRAEVYQRVEKALSREDTLSNLECRATLCRVNIRNANQAAFERLRDQSTGTRFAEWPHEIHFAKVTENPDGSVETAVYLAREGHDLPRLN